MGHRYPRFAQQLRVDRKPSRRRQRGRRRRGIWRRNGREIYGAGEAGVPARLVRGQLEAMPVGGVFAFVVPRAPFRCPPGPYGRACRVAWYFRRAKPRSKVLILDANEDIVSKKALFTHSWENDYK